MRQDHGRSRRPSSRRLWFWHIVVPLSLAGRASADASPALIHRRGPLRRDAGSDYSSHGRWRAAHEYRGPLPPLGLLALGFETHEVAESSDQRYAVVAQADAPVAAAPSAAVAAGSAGAIAGVNSTSAAASEVHQAVATTRSRILMFFSFAWVIKALCMTSNVIFQMSPIPQMTQFVKCGDTGEADAAPFISILYGGCQWCFYGLFAFLVTKKSGFLVLVYSNVLGAVLGFYYVWGFQHNCRNKHALRRLNWYMRAVGIAALLQVLAMLALPQHQALFLCGLASCVCSVVVACSLLATLPKILETKCSASINLPLVMVGMASTMLWLVCGLMLWDAWIILPNVFCLLVNCVAISLMIVFPRDPEQAALLVAAGSVSATSSDDELSLSAVAAAGRWGVQRSLSAPWRRPGGADQAWAQASDGGESEEAPLLRRSNTGLRTLAAAIVANGTGAGRRPREGAVAALAAAARARRYGASNGVPDPSPINESPDAGAGAGGEIAAAWPPPSPPLPPQRRPKAKSGGSPEGETGGTW